MKKNQSYLIACSINFLMPWRLSLFKSSSSKLTDAFSSKLSNALILFRFSNCEKIENFVALWEDLLDGWSLSIWGPPLFDDVTGVE